MKTTQATLRSLYILLFSALFLAACDSADDNTPEPLPGKLVLEAPLPDGQKVALYGLTEKLYDGYNHLYAQVRKADGSLDTQAKVGLYPLMDMGTTKHVCPVDSLQQDGKGTAKGGILFNMPSAGGTWALKIKVGNQETSLPIEVLDKKTTWKVLNTDPAYGNYFQVIRKKPYVIGYYFADGMPRVGNNNLVVTVYEMKSMMEFAPLEGVQIETTPYMPSMGHGSSNNQHPTKVLRPGYYQGVVNFNMTGDWQLKLLVKKADGTPIVEADKESFYLEF